MPRNDPNSVPTRFLDCTWVELLAPKSLEGLGESRGQHPLVTHAIKTDAAGARERAARDRRHQRASHARLPDRRPGAQRGQGSIDFDGDTLECAAGVLGVASEPAPRVGAGTDDPGLVGGEDGALTFG